MRAPIGLTGLAMLLAACASDVPQRADIIAALERAQLAETRIPLERIRSADCRPAATAFRCDIVYVTARRTDGGSGIDRLERMSVEIERVGKIWRVGRIVLT